jgi:hypothetical protein
LRNQELIKTFLKKYLEIEQIGKHITVDKIFKSKELMIDVIVNVDSFCQAIKESVGKLVAEKISNVDRIPGWIYPENVDDQENKL